MPTLTLNIKYKVNTLAPFSAQDLRDKFLAGLPNDFNGSSVPDETLDFYIQAAFEQLESTLGIKLSRQLVTETFDFVSEDWISWGQMKTTYPVVAPVSLYGYLGQNRQVTYPADWMSARETTDGKTYSRYIRLIPYSGTVNYENTSAMYLGTYTSQLSWWRSNRNIPNYWKISYITGWDKIPADLLMAVSMIATLPILMLISDQYIGTRGLGFGVSSKSIGIDGLSQSVSSYSASGIFGAKIKQYGDQLYGSNGKPGLLDILKDTYGGIVWAAF